MSGVSVATGRGTRGFGRPGLVLIGLCGCADGSQERVLGTQVASMVVDGDGDGFGAWIDARGAAREGRLRVGYAARTEVRELGLDGRLLGAREQAVDPVPSVRRLGLRCETGAGCDVLLDGRVVDRVAAGGDVAIVDGLPCWSDVQAERDDAPGQVRCDDGTVVEGIPGEHLGQQLAVADGVLWATGRFTRWDGRPRGRVVPVVGAAPDGAAAWVVERAADASPLAVGAVDGWVVVGVPGHGDGEVDQGRVYIVQTDAL